MKSALKSFDLSCTASSEAYLGALQPACGSLCFVPESTAFHGFRLTGTVFSITFCVKFLPVIFLVGLMLTEPAAISAAAALE